MTRYTNDVYDRDRATRMDHTHPLTTTIEKTDEQDDEN